MVRLFIIALSSLILLLSSCCSTKVKIAPEYQGVDERAQRLLEEYMWLSIQNNITFYNKVTIGFKKIGRDDVVGLCTYGLTFREIDLDIDYWQNSTSSQKIALLFHELTHCLCHRGHDYSGYDKYPESYTERLIQALEWKVKGGPKPGFFDDGCPISLMYPIVVDDDCLRAHYDQYVKEMFSRCKPW